MSVNAFIVPFPRQPRTQVKSSSPLHPPISRHASRLHSPSTRAKIGQSVARNAAIKRNRRAGYMLSLENRSGEEKPVKSGKNKKPKRKMSDESRAKISAALKGRAKSEAHKESLRKRFEGAQNPMYGRKMSKESRAKISEAMTTRARRRREEKEEKRLELSEEIAGKLRDKAKTSRLFEKKRPVGRSLSECAEEREVEQLLGHVRRGERPPENVRKVVEKVKERRSIQKPAVKSNVCTHCGGGGFVECPECVGAFGVTGRNCQACFGAGSVFCTHCQGVGQITLC